MNIAAIVSNAGDRLNPVFVREVRRLVRNRVVLVCYLLTMGLSFLIFLGYLLNNRRSGFNLAEAEGMAGFNFTFYTAGICALVLALGNMLASTASEREPERVDMLFLTPVSAWQYVRGKMLAALLTIFILLGGAMPFIVLWTFMPGVSLVLFWNNLAKGLAFALPLLSLYLFVALLPVSKPLQRVVAALLTFFCLSFLPGMLISFSIHGRSSAIAGNELIVLWLASLALTGVLLINAGAAILPKSANRAAFVRGTATGAILVAFGTFLVGNYVFSGTTSDAAQGFIGIVTPFYFLIAIGIGIGTDPGRRVLHNLPRRKLWRLLWMPFCNGGVNALAWTGLGGALIIACAFFVDPGGSFFAQDARIVWLAAYLCYPVFCALLGVLFCRLAFRKSAPSRGREIAVNGCIMGGLMLFYLFMNIGRIDDDFFFGNPFQLIYDDNAFNSIHSTVILVGTFVLLLLNRAWLGEGVSRYWGTGAGEKTAATPSELPPEPPPAGVAPAGEPGETAM